MGKKLYVSSCYKRRGTKQLQPAGRVALMAEGTCFAAGHAQGGAYRGLKVSLSIAEA